MGTTVDEFIESTDIKIDRLKLEGRKKTYFFSMKFSSKDIDILKAYYKNKGFEFDAHSCPRGLWDIFITFY